MFGLFRKHTQPAASWDLSTPLLRWNAHDVWSLRAAVEGTLVSGTTGSGKSSGSGKAIRTAMVRAGFGGLVLTAKADETAMWKAECEALGRGDDLIIVGEEGQHRFNMLDYEFNRPGRGGGHTENIVGLFMNVMEMRDRNSRQGGNGGDAFWRENALAGLRNCVDLVAMATGHVSLSEIIQVWLSAPASPAQVRDPEFQGSSLCFEYLRKADTRPKSRRQEHDFRVVCDYWLGIWPNLAERTRSSIQAHFLGPADLLDRGLLYSLFCTDTTITPEVAEDGKIILIDLSVKEYSDVGQIAQTIFKYCWQRSWERRDIARNPRPLFLYIDEAQSLITSYDAQFQATCRSAKVATVLLTQNYSNFLAALGGSEKARAETDSLFANLNTKIFHNNSDPVTNEWASGIIGRSRQCLANGSSSYSAEEQANAVLGLSWLGASGSTSGGFSETWEYEVQPREFTRLRTGGPANDWLVDAILFQNGRVFRGSGRTWLPVTFRQKA